MTFLSFGMQINNIKTTPGNNEWIVYHYKQCFFFCIQKNGEKMQFVLCKAFVKAKGQWRQIFVKTIGKSIYALLLFVRI